MRCLQKGKTKQTQEKTGVDTTTGRKPPLEVAWVHQALHRLFPIENTVWP